ncbi:hypothetical protein MKEN_00132100 [Mycena kentingensis (nom. inval.)]|nr:hypothetical protein MKEN_00132100 [Mycena kentingensis (nom. inval.)]
MDRLSPEILSRVFFHATIPSPAALFEPGSRIASQAPPTELEAVLSRVNHRWRQAALDCPQLWAYFTLFIDGPETNDSQPRIATAVQKLDSAYAARSQLWLLRLWIRSNSVDLLCDSYIDFAPLFDALRTHSRRIESLDVRLGPALMELLTTTAPKMSFPKLWHLAFDVVDSDRRNTDIPRVMFESRELRSLSLVHFPPPEGSPWEHLVHFSADGIEPDMFLEVLRRAPNLIHAQVSLYPKRASLGFDAAEESNSEDEYEEESQEASNGGRLKHSKLEHLEIRTAYNDSYDDWDEVQGPAPHALTFFSCPALRSFTLGDSEYGPTELGQDPEGTVVELHCPFAVQEFLKHSGKRLQTFSFLHTWWLSAPQPVFRQLEIVELILGYVQAPFNRALAALLRADSSLPQLRRLEVRCHENEEGVSYNHPDVPYDANDNADDNAGLLVLHRAMKYLAPVILRRNSRSRRPGGTSALQEFTVLSNARDAEAYGYEEKTLGALGMRKLQRSGVVVRVGSVDLCHRVI